MGTELKNIVTGIQDQYIDEKMHDLKRKDVKYKNSGRIHIFWREKDGLVWKRGRG